MYLNRYNHFIQKLTTYKTLSFTGGLMKSLLTIATLIFGLTQTSLAQVNIFQTEVARTVAEVSNVSSQIKTIKLNESGVLTVITQNGNTRKLMLTNDNRLGLLNAAHTLTSVDVVTEQRDFVCYVVVSPFTNNKLSVIDLDTNKLRLVLSPSHCVYNQFTRPTDSQSLEIAQTLKAQMIALAQQVIEAVQI